MSGSQGVLYTLVAGAVMLGLVACERQPEANVADGDDAATAEAPAADAAGPADTAGAEGVAADAAATPDAGTVAMVRLADIAANPAAFEGKTVTVEANLEEVLAPFAFALDEDAPVAGGIDNDVLVFSRKASDLAPIDDQWLNNRVRVTGVVHTMAVVDVEREIGWDLDPQIEAELEGREPVIMATAVERLEATRTAEP